MASSLVSGAIGFALVALVAIAVGAPTAAQAPSAPTFVVTPRSGWPGTIADLSGTGWGGSVSTPTVTYPQLDRTADAHVSIAGGRLTGTLTIPSDIAGGTAVNVRACAVSVAEDTSSSCATARFIVARPTVTVAPTTGPGGTVVELSGIGWGEPAGTAEVTLRGAEGAAAGQADVVDGRLTGSVTIPSSVGGGRRISVQVCAPYAVGATSCATTEFSVEPRLTASPTTALPGTTLELGGSWCCFPSAVDAVWQSTGTVIGSIRTSSDGTITGAARIPLEAGEGGGVISVCDGDVDDETCATANVDVQPPTLRSDRPDYEIGAPVELTGEGWCCPSEPAQVTDAADGGVWGEGTVDADGRLRAGGTVPNGSAGGEHELSVCVGQRCRPIGLGVRLAPPPVTGAPTTAPPATAATTVPPPTTAPSVTTVPVTTPAPLPAWTDRTSWLVVALAVVVAAGAVAGARRRSRVRRPGRLVARPRPPVHHLSPRPVAIVVKVEPPHTSTEARSTS